MIEPTDADIGRSVLYTGNRHVGGKPERGVVTGFNHWTVFVRYGADTHAKGTNREDLEWESMMRKPGQFRDITALEVLRDGQAEAMENLGGAALAMSQVSRMIDARFAAIEARLKAIEDALGVARPGVAMPSGAGRGAAGLGDAPHGEDIEK